MREIALLEDEQRRERRSCCCRRPLQQLQSAPFVCGETSEGDGEGEEGGDENPLWLLLCSSDCNIRSCSCVDRSCWPKDNVELLSLSLTEKREDGKSGNCTADRRRFIGFGEILDIATFGILDCDTCESFGGTVVRIEVQAMKCCVCASTAVLLCYVFCGNEKEK